jgi:glycosidase
MALAHALHDRGMYLMVDVVANHMVGDTELYAYATRS